MIGRVNAVVLDCPDPTSLSAFYAEVTGLRKSYEDDDWISLGEQGAPLRLAFQRAAEYEPPTWPDPATPQQFHLDILVDDLDVGERQVLALGAKKLPGGGTSFRVYADPAGHPFCLVLD